VSTHSATKSAKTCDLMAFRGANEIVSPMISTAHLAILPEASRHWMISLGGRMTPQSPDETRSSVATFAASELLLKGKCALGPFLSILVIECQHRCLNVNLYPWMDKVQIKSKGMFLSLSTLF
jgi:hypothetical protein